MSSSAKAGPSAPAEKKPPNSLVMRMKSVLQRKDGSKRLSFLRLAGASGESSSAGLSTPATSAVATPPVAVEEVNVSPEVPQPKRIFRSDVLAERARKLGERFQVNIEPYEVLGPSTDREVYRVEKPVRMRVHRSCHRCSTVFGGNRTCTSCEHTRCTKCPRFPPKKPEGKGKEKQPKPLSEPVGGIEVDHYWNLADGLTMTLTKPNPRPGGQPLVRKKPVQRVRRTCCGCTTTYQANSKICTGCSHVRCVDCPRDPAKKKNYPNGYPGDAPSSDTSKPVKYTCHLCTKAYPPVPHPDSDEGKAQGPGTKPACVRCGHERCERCPRAAPRKVEPDPDPEIMRMIEAKLAELNIDTARSSAAAVR
ncbi:uncharacterized protein BP5553_10249 [Venustampulla echinocandica]|uniref:Uncharacterized protein n=1 Tax=Venustampulla echinocandica TaxID=2656787 RepID=A0A370T9Q5_9HELO|nr:uncharacterized protein BP5553_10249 [Venustampulla echinocandica]RDL30371.1 hypothetical protein BP5553_10249 [Venustampulla echinocandica]